MSDDTATASTASPDFEPYRILMMCLGNICRSPTARIVMQDRIERAGLAGRVVVDSAGTGGWHAGEPADPRAAATLSRHGYDPTHVARQIRPHDLADFDLILGADTSNVSNLRDLARTPAEAAKVRHLRSFDPTATADDLDVPDPYYGEDGFEHVLALIEAACDGLVARLLIDPANPATGTTTSEGGATAGGGSSS